jgi:hypothetical protein
MTQYDLLVIAVRAIFLKFNFYDIAFAIVVMLAFGAVLVFLDLLASKK